MLLNLFSDQPTGINNLVLNFVKILNVKVTKDIILDKMQSHPDYPSMLSISDTLNKININTLALTIEKDQFLTLSQPFISVLNDHNKSFVIVESINEEKTVLINDQGKKSYQPTASFMKTVEGTVLVAEPSEGNMEKEYLIKSILGWANNLRFVIGYFVFFLLGFIIIKQQIIPQSSLTGSAAFQLTQYTLFFIGMILSSVLIWIEYDQNNTALKRVCSLGKDTSCTAVLTNKGSKIFNLLSWSEIGLFYFCGSVIYMINAIGKPENISIIFLLTILCSGYPIYSILYQWLVIRQWCVLCLCIQLILITSMIISLLTLPLPISNILYLRPHNLDLLVLIKSYLITPLVWWFFKPFLYKNRRSMEAEYKLARFKNNEYVFNTMLAKEMIIRQKPNNLGVSFGDPSSPNYLLKVCNPFCSACSKSQMEIDDLVKGTSNWYVQIIYYIPKSDFDNPIRKTVAHFLALYDSLNKESAFEAISYWYRTPKKDYEAFAKKYPTDKKIEEYNSIIEEMIQWGENENIRYTPTIYVNGHLIPELYSVSDLTFI